MNLKYMAKNLGLELAKQLKKASPIQLIVLVLVVMFILYDTSLPADIEDFIREPFGKFVLLVIVLGSFASFGVVVGFLVMIAAYEMIRRSGETHQSKMQSKLMRAPSKLYEDNHSLSAMNQFPITLEEEVIHNMVPLVKGDLGPKTYKPTVSEIDGTTQL
jgi:hypothetical protein